MSKNRQDDKQLSLDFQRGQMADGVHRALAAQTTSSPSLRGRLSLIVNNDNGRGAPQLSPNSPEITRILAGQAKKLGW